MGTSPFRTFVQNLDRASHVYVFRLMSLEVADGKPWYSTLSGRITVVRTLKGGTPKASGVTYSIGCCNPKLSVGHYYLAAVSNDATVIFQACRCRRISPAVTGLTPPSPVPPRHRHADRSRQLEAIMLHIFAVAGVLLLWAALASPFVLALYFVLRALRRRGIRTAAAVVLPALVFAMLAAPVPTPIITVFLPHGFMLLDAAYYDRILHGPALFMQLWAWIACSLSMTFLLALALCWRYLRSAAPPRPASSFDDAS